MELQELIDKLQDLIDTGQAEESTRVRGLCSNLKNFDIVDVTPDWEYDMDENEILIVTIDIEKNH